MCGISGIFDLRGKRNVDQDLLKVMNRSQAHRGPDGEGYHFEPGVGLGHRRLAIIDLEGGAQPMFNEDESVAVTFNGEIYNFLEICDLLRARGHVFRTRCDTEVIVHAWEEWGEACVERFNGMFAFAIWDRNQNCLFPRTRPDRHKAALLRRIRRRIFPVWHRAESADGASAIFATNQGRGGRGLFCFRLRAGSQDDIRAMHTNCLRVTRCGLT